MYDEIVDTAKKENFKVTAEGPILTLPEDFSFGLMVPKDKGDQFESNRFDQNFLFHIVFQLKDSEIALVSGVVVTTNGCDNQLNSLLFWNPNLLWN